MQSGSLYNQLILEFLGKPYAKGASGPDAYDCYSFCRAFAERVGLPLPDLGHLDPEKAGAVNEQSQGQFERLSYARPWSLVTFREDKPFATHCGIVLPKDDLFIHCNRKSGVVCEPLHHRHWQPSIEGYYWPRDIIEVVVLLSPIHNEDKMWLFTPRSKRTLGDILNNEQFVALNIPLRAFLDGKEVLPQDWPSTSLQAVRQIVLRPQLSGGGDKRRGVAIMMLTFAFTAIGAAAFGPALATGAIGAIEYGILMAGTQMAAGFALNAMIPPKKPERLAGADAYAWSPHTTQEAGTPIDRIYGKVPVYGNLIMGYTVPSNAMDGYSPWHQLIWDLPASGILTSEHTIYSKVGYGDGPIKGVVDGSVRLNDVDPTEFEGFAISHFRGTNSQSAASFGDRVQYQPTFKELSTSESQTFTLPDKDVTGIAVIIGSPEGINTTAHSQKILPGRVKIKIEMRAVGGSWHTLMDGRLAAKSAQWLREIYYNDETYEGGSAFTVSRGTQYEIRVTRVSDKSSDRRGQIYLEAVQGIYNDGFTYPGLAYSALSGVATSDINSRLQFRAVVEGRILQVWKGSYWTFEYNNNPAWVIFDLLTRPVIKGDYPPTPYEAEFYRGIDPSWIDVDAFYALAQWCDEMVDDGKGGTEKRFTFNGVFNSTDTAWNQVLRVASMCRAYPYFNGRKVTLWIDKPATPVQVFTVGNIVSGEYEETWFGHEGRISEWQCSILDENQDYRRSPVTIRDTSVARRVIEKLAPIGVTRQSQLWRMVAHLEEVNKLMSRSVTFPADLDAIYSTLGGVIYLQHDITNVNQGGRITVVAGMTITVDFTPQDEGGGYSVLVRTADETNGENLKLYTVSSISGQEITVTAESWTYTPQANDVVMYGTTSQINDLYRIRSMRRTPDGRVAITAQVYDENYYGTDSLEPITSTMRALQSPNASVVPRDEQITWKRLQQTYPEATVYGPGASGIYSLDLSWSGNGTDQVTWAGTDEFDKGTICIRGDDYVIAGGSTTKKYVYFDTEAGDTTVMQTSDSEADLLPAGRYLWCINKNGTPYLKQGVEVGKDASIINLDDAAMGASYRKEFEENFEDTFGDVEDQWTEYGSAGLEIISTGGVAGGKFLRVGDNSGNDQAEVVRYNRIPYDPTAMYRVRVRVKQQAGSGTTYVGVACRNKADTAWVYIDGSDSNHGAHWIVLNDVALDGEWTVYTGYVHGTSDSPSHGQFSDPNNPGQLHSDVGYIMPFFACNTSYEAGEFDIDFFCIDVMPESTDQIASSALYSKEFHEYFQNPIQDVEVRWPSYSGSGELSVVTGGVSGGKFLRAGDDSGNDEARLIYYRSIPFDPSFLYRIRCRVRRNSGAGKCYLGIAGRNGADDAWVNISGADLISAQHYLAAYDQGPTSSWTEFTGYLKGSAATGTASEAHNPAAPGHLHEDARWFRPMIVVNYDSQAGQYDIDEFSVDVIPDQVGSVQLSVLDYGAVGGQDCTEAFQDCIDACIASGKTMLVPRGTYLVNSTLLVSSGTDYVEGFTMEGEGQPTIKWTGSGTDTLLYLQNVCQAHFGNILVDGDNIAGLTGVHLNATTGKGTKRCVFENFHVLNCPVIGVRIGEEGVNPLVDYITWIECSIKNNGINVSMESENSRGINFHSGSLLEATTYNIDLQAGGIFGFDMFMGDAGTADINLRGQLVHFALYGGHSESPVFLTTQAAAQSGSIFLGPHVTSGFSQDGNSPAATVVEYDTVKPWSMQSCKWQGNVNLGSNVKQVISICSEFTAGDFTGATDKVMKLGHKAESYPNFECGPFKIEQAAGYPAGIMLRDIDDTQSARIYRSDGMPDTYYGKLGDFALAVNYGLSECLGWACTVSGDFEQETVKATYVPVGIVGTVTTWAKTLLDDPDAATARTTLGLGTMATQDADDVAITGGSIAGLTSPLAVADGGTGGSTKAAAKTSLVLSGSRSWHETRTLPTTVNNYVEVGSLTKSACGYNVDIAVTVSDSGFSVAKRYLITARYTGTTSGTWYTARPLSSTGAYSGQDFALDVMWDQSTSKLTFRLRRSSGSTAGDAHVVLHDKGHSSTTFAALTGTGSMAAPSAWWPSTVMSQCDGVVDIDELTLVTPLDIPYGGTNADNAADARANLGVLTQIANNPTAKTGDYSVTAADTGKLFSNAGATGTVTLTLPSATVGLVYAFARTAAQIIYAHAGSGNDFRGRPGKKLELMSEESVVIVRCFETGVWNVWTLFGSYQWVDE